MKLTCVLFAASVLAAPSLAHADTIFNVTGQLDSVINTDKTGVSESSVDFSGTITLNSASTAFSAVDIAISVEEHRLTFHSISLPQAIDGVTRFSVEAEDSEVSEVLWLYLPVSSLDGYHGSEICSVVFGSCGASNDETYGEARLAGSHAATPFASSVLINGSIKRQNGGPDPIGPPPNDPIDLPPGPVPSPVFPPSPAAVTAEPTSIALLGSGLLGLAGVVRRRSA